MNERLRKRNVISDLTYDIYELNKMKDKLELKKSFENEEECECYKETLIAIDNILEFKKKQISIKHVEYAEEYL